MLFDLFCINNKIRNLIKQEGSLQHTHALSVILNTKVEYALDCTFYFKAAALKMLKKIKNEKK